MLPQRLKPGFGLLEVILVFVIFMGAAAIVFSVFHSAEASAEASNAVEQVKLVVGNLQSLNQTQHATTDQNIFVYGNYNDANGDAIRQLVFKGIPPVNTNSGFPSYQGAWDGSSLHLTMPTMVPGITNENAMWAVEYDGVDADGCPRFVMGVAPLVDALVMSSSISVSGNLNSAIVKPIGGALNTSQVVALCSEFQADGSQYGSQYGSGHVFLIGH